MIAHDIFAETNPAFCTYALHSFAKAYISLNQKGAEIALIYLALPIALSGDLSKTFQGTNKNTGLSEWLKRNPSIQLNLGDRLNGALDIVSEGLRLACFTQIIAIDDNSRVQLGTKALKNVPAKEINQDIQTVMKHAERLGYWFAMSGSTRTVFNLLELTL